MSRSGVMKYLIMPSSVKQVCQLIDDIDGIIVGLNKLCVNMPITFNYDEILEFNIPSNLESMCLCSRAGHHEWTCWLMIMFLFCVQD